MRNAPEEMEGNASYPPSAHVVDPNHAILLLIDVQPRFLESMAGDRESVLIRLEHLLKLAAWYDLPTIATFEHPVDVKGWLPDRLADLFPPTGRRHVKQRFDLTAEPAIRAELLAQPRRQALVAGAETDVCVLQSVLGLIRLEFRVYLIEDCLFTSEPHPGPAIRRMENAGAVPITYKTLHYELQHGVAGSKAIDAWNEADVSAGHPRGRFRSPEDLPDWTPSQ
jgi:nicotinamidase-related amidase